MISYSYTHYDPKHPSVTPRGDWVDPCYYHPNIRYDPKPPSVTPRGDWVAPICHTPTNTLAEFHVAKSTSHFSAICDKQRSQPRSVHGRREQREALKSEQLDSQRWFSADSKRGRRGKLNLLIGPSEYDYIICYTHKNTILLYFIYYSYRYINYLYLYIMPPVRLYDLITFILITFISIIFYIISIILPIDIYRHYIILISLINGHKIT